MKKIQTSIVGGLVLLFALQTTVKAQYVLTEADQQYTLYNYNKAIVLYQRAYQKKASLHAAKRLAECYKNQQNYTEAERWYAISTAMPGSPAVQTLYYAQALQSNAKYAEAKQQYHKYAEQYKGLSEQQKDLWLQSCDSAMHWMKFPTEIRIQNEKSLNSAQSDWGAVKNNNQLVFASDRNMEGKDQQTVSRPFLKFDGIKTPNRNVYGWTGNSYLRLYSQNGSDSVQVVSIKTGTPYHVGPASFTADGRTMYFTLTKIPKDGVYEKVKGSKDKLTTINVEIYSSTRTDDGVWSAPKAFKYNNAKEFSLGDPFITADGKRLYFASDMPGGKGGMDLYVTEKTAGNDWGIPVNLKDINTEGNERSPTLDEANGFYFSTDGRVGMGGLDIFSARIIDGKMGQISNLRYPANSPQDDFAFQKITASTGYLSSNRAGGLGADDIYSFILPAPKKIDYTDPIVLNKEIRLENIYYDFDRWNIRPDAAVELDKLVQILKENPTIWIVLGSHTDSRGNDAYNQKLSQHRAEAAVEYIISRGGDKSRITAKGYGESRLLNRCSNGVNCSIAEHQLNRRTEFTIVKQ